MTDYRTPLADIRFTLHNIVDFEALSQLPGYEHSDTELVDGLLDEAARFFENVVAPTNRDGDTVGSNRNDDGRVSAAPGLADAYRLYVESGWGGLSFPEEYGGGNFPWTIGLAVQEMLTTANLAFSLCPLLTQGAIDALIHHGSETQREIYLQKMISGEWSGTMNLTEPQAGSDVGALTSKATPRDDGSWLITGQKIFITWGEHDMAENIIHLVLARTPDSPPGTKGISLFLVPKFLVNDDGSLGERNDVTCVSIEHKLGIHASPTCVMGYGDNDGAVGWLIGEENAGMRAMFTMMNTARLSVGLEGLAVTERAYQQALAYAHERLQGRAPGAAKGTSSPIIDHADIQRTLLDMKACIDAMRGLCYRNAEALDHASHGADAEHREQATQLAALLTPLTKAWCTDLGCELTSEAVQVHGGMGYIEETGAAQHFRDARITPIYEGTNGIQALDLVGRKLPMSGGAVVQAHLESIEATLGRLEGIDGLEVVVTHLSAALKATREATEWLLEAGAANPLDAMAGATDYLAMLAATTGGQILADAALAARGGDSADEKALLARFFATHRLARVPGLKAGVQSGSADLAIGRQTVLAD